MRRWARHRTSTPDEAAGQAGRENCNPARRRCQQSDADFAVGSWPRAHSRDSRALSDPRPAQFRNRPAPPRARPSPKPAGHLERNGRIPRPVRARELTMGAFLRHGFSLARERPFQGPSRPCPTAGRTGGFLVEGRGAEGGLHGRKEVAANGSLIAAAVSDSSPPE